MTSLCQLYTCGNYSEWCRVVVVFDYAWCNVKIQGETYVRVKVQHERAEYIQTNMRSKVRSKEILSLLAGPKLQDSIL